MTRVRWATPNWRRPALYTRVATGMIAGIESPLDLLSRPRKKRKKSGMEPPPA